MQELEFYNSKNIDELTWPEHYDGQYAKNYLMPLILNGTKKYISNVNADISIIKINNKVFPIVKTHPKEENCYVCSPYDQYITYGLEELQVLKMPTIEFIFKLIIKAMALPLRFTNFNKVIYVNNWLLSTNLYPELNSFEIEAINKKLQDLYPGSIIIYRSLNEYTNSKLMTDLERVGASKIISRQIYITDPAQPSYKKRKDFKKDQRNLLKSNITVTDNILLSDAPQIKKHYDDLYLGKYTKLNPQFTIEYLENAIEHKLFNFQVVKSNNTLTAVLGYFKRNNVMTTPIFGYDTNAPVTDALYRNISSLLLNESSSNGHILNQSSGASSFKSQRGAKPYIEYNFYFTAGSSFLQRSSWKFIQILLNTIAIRVMQKYKL
jgi:hypothetical protein